MLRLFRLAPLLLVLASDAAFAQGINLRWTECVADGGTRNTAFACNTNVGFRAVVPSFALAAPVTQVTGLHGTIDVVAADAVLPAWWNFKQCRSGSLIYNDAAAAPFQCHTVTGFCAAGISGIQPGVPAANAERIDFARTTTTGCVLPHPDLSPGLEYVAGVLSVNFTRTVGSPSCSGCDIPVCLILNQVQLTASGGDVTLTQPAIPPDGNVITWQGAALTPGGTCQAATPTRRSAWGEIKALYR